VHNEVVRMAKGGYVGARNIRSGRRPLSGPIDASPDLDAKIKPSLNCPVERVNTSFLHSMNSTNASDDANRNNSVGRHISV
jgi:hypothetical protein